MYLRIVLFFYLLMGLAFCQTTSTTTTGFNSDYEKYEILIRSIEMDSSLIQFDGYFEIGDSVGLSFSHDGVALNDSWLVFDSAKDISAFIINTPQIWSSDGRARAVVPVVIPKGSWQLRIRTVGWSHINWGVSRFSDFSDRIDIYIKEVVPNQPARIYLILQ